VPTNTLAGYAVCIPWTGATEFPSDALACPQDGDFRSTAETN
jgi:hypothetical protein